MSLTAAISPLGPTATLSPASVSFGIYGGSATSNLTVSVPWPIASGFYQVNVTAEQGKQTASTIVKVGVPDDVEITVAIGDHAIAEWEVGTFQETATEHAFAQGLSFSGTVYLSAQSVLCCFSVSPTSLSLSPGAYGSSTVSIAVPGPAPNGTYSFTLTGTYYGFNGTTNAYMRASATAQIVVCTPKLVNNPTWAGEELMQSCIANDNVPVYLAYAEWVVPSVGVPLSGPNCQSVACAITVWVGLTNDEPGTYIVQAGSSSEVYVTCGLISCSPHYVYNGWYEFWTPSGGPPTNCLIINPGDYMEVLITNEAFHGGSAAKYDINVTDATTGKSCGTSGFDFSVMGTPRYADFMVERPLTVAGTASVPQFSDFPVNRLLVGSSYDNEPIFGGWYVQDTMVNNGNTNVTCQPFVNTTNPDFYGGYGLQYHYVTSQGT